MGVHCGALTNQDTQIVGDVVVHEIGVVFLKHSPSLEVQRVLLVAVYPGIHGIPIVPTILESLAVGCARSRR